LHTDLSILLGLPCVQIILSQKWLVSDPLGCYPFGALLNWACPMKGVIINGLIGVDVIKEDRISLAGSVFEVLVLAGTHIMDLLGYTYW
jgi:hypothetical protein